MSLQFNSVKVDKGLAGAAKERANVRAASVVDVTLVAGVTVGGVVVADGDRVLLANQNNSLENGLWKVGTPSTRTWDSSDTDWCEVVVTEGVHAGVWRVRGVNCSQETVAYYTTGSLVYATSPQTLAVVPAAVGVLQNNGAIVSWAPRPAPIWCQDIVVTSSTFVAVASFAYIASQYLGTGTVLLEVEITSSPVEIHVSGSTAVYSTSGFYTLNFTAPVMDSRLQLEVRRTAGADFPVLRSVQLLI